MNDKFTDKELQIAAQLGYFSFNREMIGKTLGELFEEKSIPKTSLKLAVYELEEMLKTNQIDKDSYVSYVRKAEDLLAFQLHLWGLTPLTRLG